MKFDDLYSFITEASDKDELTGEAKYYRVTPEAIEDVSTLDVRSIKKLVQRMGKPPISLGITPKFVSDMILDLKDEDDSTSMGMTADEYKARIAELVKAEFNTPDFGVGSTKPQYAAKALFAWLKNPNRGSSRGTKNYVKSLSPKEVAEYRKADKASRKERMDAMMKEIQKDFEDIDTMPEEDAYAITGALSPEDLKALGANMKDDDFEQHGYEKGYDY